MNLFEVGTRGIKQITNIPNKTNYDALVINENVNLARPITLKNNKIFIGMNDVIEYESKEYARTDLCSIW